MTRPRHINRTLSEDDILYLQDIFLTNGVHAIKVSNVATGRVLIYKLLQSLHYHHVVACLTCAENPPLKRSIFDVYRAIMHHELGPDSYDDIEDFFIERFYADFLWVELSHESLKKSVVTHATNVVRALDIDSRMPIVTISYDA